MGYAFYKTNFNDPTVKLVCLCCEIAYAKNHKKQAFRSSNGTKLFDGYKRNITIKRYFNSDFDDFYSYTP